MEKFFGIILLGFGIGVRSCEVELDTSQPVVYLESTDSTVIMCKALCNKTNNDDVHLRWYGNNDQLIIGGFPSRRIFSYNKGQRNQLFLRDVTPGDNGTYTCVMKTKRHTSKQSVSVVITEKGASSPPVDSKVYSNLILKILSVANQRSEQTLNERVARDVREEEGSADDTTESPRTTLLTSSESYEVHSTGKTSKPLARNGTNYFTAPEPEPPTQVSPITISTPGDKVTRRGTSNIGSSTSGTGGNMTPGGKGSSTSGTGGHMTSGGKGSSTSGTGGHMTPGGKGSSTSGTGGHMTSGGKGSSTSGTGGHMTPGGKGSSTSGNGGHMSHGGKGSSASGNGGDMTDKKSKTPTSPVNSAETAFGKHGVLAFSLTLGVAFLLLYALILVLILPRCRQTRKKKHDLNKDKSDGAKTSNMELLTLKSLESSPDSQGFTTVDLDSPADGGAAQEITVAAAIAATDGVQSEAKKDDQEKSVSTFLVGKTAETKATTDQEKEKAKDGDESKKADAVGGSESVKEVTSSNQSAPDDTKQTSPASDAANEKETAAPDAVKQTSSPADETKKVEQPADATKLTTGSTEAASSDEKKASTTADDSKAATGGSPEAATTSTTTSSSAPETKSNGVSNFADELMANVSKFIGSMKSDLLSDADKKTGDVKTNDAEKAAICKTDSENATSLETQSQSTAATNATEATSL
ncbi:mucin-5AC-like [Gigantopelta aegis]|uniref:mucin-5AC-like n=1 Tax=Gigantopelta aegis TaxID=1735272 RepID=UPI001B88BBF0|nr:mucin-5AC-like [Gigantopelta aegis]